MTLTTWPPPDGPATLPADPHIREMPPAAREYCSRKGIVDEVRAAISLAGQHFAVSGDPVFEVVADPEHGEDLIAIHVWARGEPEEVFQQSEAFLDSYLPGIDPAKRQHISLIYHPVQT